MEYKKERNFIVAYEDNIAQGKWDIITGDFYGKRGKHVASIPYAFTFNALTQWGMDDNSRYYGKCIEIYRKDYNHNYHYNGVLCEQIISLKLRFSTLNVFRVNAFNIPLTKDVVEYLKQEHAGYFEVSYIKEYLIKKQYKNFIDTLSDESRRLFISLYNDLPIEYLKTMLNRMEKEHVIEYNSSYRRVYSDSNLFMIRNYYNMCMEMYGTVKVEPNIVSNYIQINYLYKRYKEENYDKILKKNNDKTFLYFENDDFIAFPLLSKEKFHKEAESQHNCVERMYMEEVANNKTYITAVRKKNDPKASYITCEVTHKGLIRQYLLSFNRSPIDDPSAMKFKEDYQNYIFQHLEEA